MALWIKVLKFLVTFSLFFSVLLLIIMHEVILMLEKESSVRKSEDMLGLSGDVYINNNTGTLHVKYLAEVDDSWRKTFQRFVLHKEDDENAPGKHT